MDKYDLLDEIRKYTDEHFQPKSFIPGKSIVEVSEPNITSEDIQAVVDVVLDGWFTEWKQAAKLNRMLANYTGIEHSVLCNSGSSANLLAIAAAADEYKSKKGGLVVTAATCFPTTVSAIIQNGFIPYFVDTNPHTLNVSVDTVLAACENPDVVGAILTHTLGFPFDAEFISYELDTDQWFIEDICDALGAELGGKKVGMFGDMATLSAFPAHHITTGEGGAILTGRIIYERLLEQYRSWGRDCWCLPGQDDVCGKRFGYQWDKLPDGYDHKYTFTKVGYNLKMTEIQAALGVSQMKRIFNFVESRLNNFDVIRAMLGRYHDHLRFIELREGTRPSPFGFPITVDSEHITKNELVKYLEDHNIRTRPLFAGNIIRQPMMYSQPYLGMGDLAGSDYIMNNTFWIGCHPNLTEAHLSYVFQVFEDFFREKRLG